MNENATVFYTDDNFIIYFSIGEDVTSYSEKVIEGRRCYVPEKKSTSRYWIRYTDGKELDGRWEYTGFSEVRKPNNGFLPAKVRDGFWVVIIPGLGVIPEAANAEYGYGFYDVGSIEQGKLEVSITKGIVSYLDVNGVLYSKKLSGDYVRIPSRIFGGLFLSESVFLGCIRSYGTYYQQDSYYQLFDHNFEPLDRKFKSFDLSLLPWAIIIDNEYVFYLESQESISLYVYNCVSSQLSKISSECYLLTITSEEKDEDSYPPTTKRSSTYCLVFKNQFIFTSSFQPEIDKKNRLIFIVTSDTDKEYRGCISFKGKYLLYPVYDELTFMPKAGFISKRNENSFSFTSQGYPIVDNEKRTYILDGGILSFSKIDDDMVIIEKPRGYGLYSLSSNSYQVPCVYAVLKYYSSDIVIVATSKYGDCYGVIDSKGRIVIPCVYGYIEQTISGFSFWKNRSEKANGINGEGLIFTTDRLMRRVLKSKGKLIRVPAEYDIQPFYKKGFFANEEFDLFFNHGLCIVRRNGKYGIINEFVNEVLPCEYEDIYCVSEVNSTRCKFALYENTPVKRFCIYDHLSNKFIWPKDVNGISAIVTFERSNYYISKNNNLYGLLDSRFHPIVPAEYASIDVLTCGLLALKEKGSYLWSLAKMNGKLLSRFSFECIRQEDGVIVCGPETWNEGSGKISIFDLSGKCLIPEDQGAIAYEKLDNELIKVRYQNDERGIQFRLLKSDWTPLFEEYFSYIGSFIDGEALAAINGDAYYSEEKRDYDVVEGLWGVINELGHIVVQPKYAFIRKKIEGFRVVACGQYYDLSYGVVNEDGEEVLSCEYKYLGDACNKQFVVASQGEWLWEGEKREALFTPDGSCRWLKNSTWSIIGVDGNYVTPEYEFVYRALDGVSIVRNNGKYGFYNYHEKILFVPQYHYLEGFSEGLCVAGVRMNDRYLFGYIDKLNKNRIPYQFVRAFHFVDGNAHVETEDDYCVINMKGEIVRKDNKEELQQQKDEEDAWRAKAEYEAKMQEQMIRDGLLEAFNGDLSNMWNID